MSEPTIAEQKKLIKTLKTPERFFKVDFGRYGAEVAMGSITKEQFDRLAVAINTGTNLPSVATPNGQAAFLFLLTSSVAPLLGLSYLRMVLMALPYTIVLSVVGVLSVIYFL